MMKFSIWMLAVAAGLAPSLVLAQVPPEVDACKATGLAALKQKSPSIQELTFDIDTLAISKAETKVEDTPVKMVIMGDAYLQRPSSDKPNRFVCLVGEKGKVLLTFFTEQ